MAQLQKLTLILFFFSIGIFANAQTTADRSAMPNAGLILPAGFHADMIANNLGRTRHLVVTPQNEIYVRLARPVNHQGTLLLHLENGKAVVKSGFGDFGGTGIVLRNGYLYTSSNTEVFRYKLDANNQVDVNSEERIVKGLIDRGQHETKSLAMDDEGNLFVTIGAPSNSCQEKDRQYGSMGIEGCPLLETTGGVWKFQTDKKDQTYTDGARFATGLRNVVGLDWNPQVHKLFVMQHGRDQLNSIFPSLYSAKESAELPAECMYALTEGANAGWPYIYYDQIRNKQMLAPEYGGDGKKEVTGKYLDPVAAYPGHLAPNGLLFYTGDQFPAKYKNGAFIAFHGSWNRAPEPQAGYFVVFQPFKNGVPDGAWEVFADNFSGSAQKTASGRAEHRPCGLAQGPDGSLYVSDDARGAIFRITYNGKDTTSSITMVQPEPDKDHPATSTPNTTGTTGTGTDKKTPETTTAKKSTTKKTTADKLPVKTTAKNKTTAKTNATVKSAVPKESAMPKGTMLAGRTVYRQICATCHMTDGRGVGNLNPPLIKTSYVLGNKDQLISIVLKGLSQKQVNGERYSNAMPSFSYLSDQQIASVLTWVRNSFGNKASSVSPADVKKLRSKK